MVSAEGREACGEASSLHGAAEVKPKEVRTTVSLWALPAAPAQGPSAADRHLPSSGEGPSPSSQGHSTHTGQMRGTAADQSPVVTAREGDVAVCRRPHRDPRPGCGRRTLWAREGGMARFPREEAVDLGG